MENLEFLVKLASFGTAGVCVLAIFIIGTSIFRLPNDTPNWKVSLMKKYMNTCIVIAIICAISGSANAYFNQNKIAKAKADFNQLGAAYDEQSKNIENEKQKIKTILGSIRTQLQHGAAASPAVLNSIQNVESGVGKLELIPKEKILKEKGLSVRPGE